MGVSVCVCGGFSDFFGQENKLQYNQRWQQKVNLSNTLFAVE